jgi:hypothetical protein
MKNARFTTDELHVIDVRFLARRGLLDAGRLSTLSWSRGNHRTGSIGIRSDGTRVDLDYSTSGSSVSQTINLTWTPCHFGGWRPWFRCPACRRRVAIVYVGWRFACRHCHGLYYSSQRHRGRWSAMHKLQRLRDRLGGSANLMEPFPAKPRHMHWATYDRLRGEAMKLEKASVGALQAAMRRL